MACQNNIFKLVKIDNILMLRPSYFIQNAETSALILPHRAGADACVSKKIVYSHLRIV